MRLVGAPSCLGMYVLSEVRSMGPHCVATMPAFLRCIGPTLLLSKPGCLPAVPACLPDCRADWKACAASKEEEEARTERFKDAFKPFDIMQ